MNKKALSAIISMLLIVALTLVLVSVVWVVIKGIIDDKISESEACSFIFDKVSLNDDYTFYNQTNKEFLFSINVGDIEIDKLLVSIDGQTFKLSNTEQDINNVVKYPDRSPGVKLPSSGSGKTYLLIGITEKPSSIKIAPIVNNIQCEVSDSRLNIRNC